jgi:hypothetical protein
MALASDQDRWDVSIDARPEGHAAEWAMGCHIAVARQQRQGEDVDGLRFLISISSPGANGSLGLFRL